MYWIRRIRYVHTNRWFDQDVKTSLDLADDMPLTQRRLVETIITLPGGGEPAGATKPPMRSLSTAKPRLGAE
jgi:hypothetical protein